MGQASKEGVAEHVKDGDHRKDFGGGQGVVCGNVDYNDDDRKKTAVERVDLVKDGPHGINSHAARQLDAETHEIH